ncbi:MAG: hypothetical protein E7616_06905 [Ruminococcaceae bacterium]|nr:hypothetical protein [Oscillospiraceae bacterium]
MKIKSRLERILPYAAVFLLGGGLYCCLEVLWRGFTHWSMAPVGGICVLLIYCIEPLPYQILWKMVLCGIGITVVEGVSGFFLNMLFQLNVWDYSELFLNLFGQVCLLFTFIWVLLSYPGMKLCSFLRRHIFS